MKERLPLPKGVPRTLRFESVCFDVIPLGDGRLAFAYYQGKLRVVVKRRTIDELREEAERIATAILNADTAAKSMTADDSRIFVSATETLAPFKVPLDAAARILRDAAQLVGGVERVVEACRFFNSAGADTRAATTAVVVAAFIRDLSASGVTQLYLKPMEADLKKFAEKFPSMFAAVRATEMSDWLRDMPVGLRRRRNLRDKLVALFNWARDNGYLPDGLRTEAEKIKRPNVKRKAPAIYTPEELDLLLVQAAQPADPKIGRADYTDFIPFITIGAFAGLRVSEIQALEWKHVHWKDGVIEVGEEHKTGYRLVPIQPNLMSWLAPYREHMGKVCKQVRPDHVMRRLGDRAGLPVGGRRYNNALRHSFVTYRVAVTKNMPLVSGESGHSVAELRKSYNRASLESAGTKWFSMSRDAGNVLQMPLLSMKRG